MGTNNNIFLIAEIAQAHEGSLGIAHSYIDSLAKTGIDAIKFQTHIAEAESSPFEQFRVKFSVEDNSRYDYWKRMEFNLDQWKGLKTHCDEVGMEFMSSPFSIAAIELLEEVGVKRYKVGSGEITNLLLLQRIAQTGKPIILSSGMSSFKELAAAIDFLKPFKNPVSVLQCTTAYPTKAEQWGLNVIEELKNSFQIPTGFSDHSGNVFACLAAASLGANILEFHATFDQRMFGPDARASLTIDQIEFLVKGIREIEKALQSPVKKDEVKDFAELKIMFGKSLAVNKPMKKGSRIELKDIESKKPANQGIDASSYKEVLGKVLAVDKDAYSFLNAKDLL